MKGRAGITRMVQCAILLVAVLVSFNFYLRKPGYTRWMPSSALSRMLRTANDDRKFPAEVQGRIADGDVQYRARFVPFLRGMDYFVSRWGMSEDWYEAYSAKLTHAGFREYSHTIFRDVNGNVLYQATWILTGKQPAAPQATSSQT